MKRVASIVAVILAVITLFVVIWQLRQIVLLFIISLTIAATVRAPIDFLMKRRIPRAFATAIVYAIGVIGLFGLLYGLSLPLTNELQQMSQDVTKVYGQLQGRWQTGHSFGAFLAARLPSADQFTAFISGGSDTTSLAEAAIVFTSHLVKNISELLISIILSMYWTTDEVHFERLWLSLLPGEQRVRARNAWHSLESGVGAYVRSELIQSLLAGVALSIGFRLLGLHYPVLWALFVALTWLIPLVGGLIAVIPLWLIASMNGGPLIAIATVFYTVAVLVVMEFFVEKRLYTRDRYAKVLVLLVMVALVDAFGLVGLLVAPIVATAIQIAVNELLAAPTRTEVSPATAAIDMSTLRARLEEVQTLIHRVEAPSSALRIANMAERLEGLLEKAEKI
jgi:predicted PurR-regulated permease PerM